MTLHDWTVNDLEFWDQKIREVMQRLELSWYPTEFHVVDWDQMMNVSAYLIPNSFGCWQKGKQYEITRKLKRYELTGLALEMVTNGNPAIAYLLRDNSLPAQVAVMAHAYVHTDFFRNNAWFRARTRPQSAYGMFRSHHEEIEAYRQDPSIPEERLEELIDAGLALQYHRPVRLGGKRETKQEQTARLVRARATERKEWDHLFPRAEQPKGTLDLEKVPLEPDDDLLRFFAEHARRLESWEKRVLTIIADEAEYFSPVIETKVMNEGWATYWQMRIMEELDRPPAFDIEHAKLWSQVVIPSKYRPNPYHLGYTIWTDLFRRWEHPDEKERVQRGRRGNEGVQKLFEVRETENDASFIGNYLTNELIAELNLYRFRWAGEEDNPATYQVVDVADAEGFDRIRQAVIRQFGFHRVPMLQVVDAGAYREHELILHHMHDGRDLKVFEPELRRADIERKDVSVSLSDIVKAMEHVWTIWKDPIALFSHYDGGILVIRWDRDGECTAKLSES